MRAGVQRVFSSRTPPKAQGIGPSAGLLSGLNTVAQQEKSVQHIYQRLCENSLLLPVDRELRVAILVTFKKRSAYAVRNSV